MDPVSQHSTIVYHLTANLCALGFDVDAILRAVLPPNLQGLPHRYAHTQLSPDMFLTRSSAMVELMVHFLLNRLEWDDVVVQCIQCRAASMRPEELGHYTRKMRETVHEDLTNMNIVFPCLEQRNVTSFKQNAKSLLDVVQGTRYFSTRHNTEAVLTEAKFRCAAFMLQLSVAVMHSQLKGEYIAFCEATPMCVLEAVRGKQIAILKERASAYVEIGKRMSASTGTLRENIMKTTHSHQQLPSEWEPSGPEHAAVETRLRWVSVLGQLHRNSGGWEDALLDPTQSTLDGGDIGVPVGLVPFVRSVAVALKDAGRKTQRVRADHLEGVVAEASVVKAKIDAALRDQKARMNTLKTVLDS